VLGDGLFKILTVMIRFTDDGVSFSGADYDRLSRAAVAKKSLFEVFDGTISSRSVSGWFDSCSYDNYEVISDADGQVNDVPGDTADIIFLDLPVICTGEVGPPCFGLTYSTATTGLSGQCQQSVWVENVHQKLLSIGVDIVTSWDTLNIIYPSNMEGCSFLDTTFTTFPQIPGVTSAIFAGVKV
jgi:hypothetical protein